MFRKVGAKANNVTKGLQWQHHNMLIKLWSGPVIEQKLNYIHQNFVKAGYVDKPTTGVIQVLWITPGNKFWLKQYCYGRY